MGQNHTKVCGNVAPGYESVKQMFENNFKEGRETKAQLCVYVEEEKVVDLWASTDNSIDYNGDSLTNVFSSGKSLTAICMAILVDKGLLDYNKKISEYWPEFGINGKDETTVADLMRHEAGLASLDTSMEPGDTDRENIKMNKIGAVIEAEHPLHPKGRRREYHAVTRGWIANEIFRRVEPTGSTIGEYLETLGVPGLHIGVPEGKLDKCHPHEVMGLSFLVSQSLIPTWIGRSVDPNIFQLVGLLNNVRQLRKSSSGGGKKPPALVGLTMDTKVFNIPAVRRGETPSANANCSARGLAMMGAIMANGGSFSGKKILGEGAWEALHAHPTDGVLFANNAKFTQGGVAQFGEDEYNPVNRGRGGFYGWMGFGRSVFQWHPELKIGFGYSPCYLTWVDMVNGKAALLQNEVKKCARKVKETEKI